MYFNKFKAHVIYNLRIYIFLGLHDGFFLGGALTFLLFSGTMKNISKDITL